MAPRRLLYSLSIRRAGKANWPLCPVFSKDRIEGVKANSLGAPPILACGVSGSDRLTEASRQGWAALPGSLPYPRAAIFILSRRRDRHEGYCGKSLGTRRFQRAVLV